MAKIGLNNFRYAILTEAQDGTPSYGGAKKPAKAVSCQVSITNNSAQLFADDALAESDSSFQSGTVSMGIDDEDNETMAELLGHTINQAGEMIRNAYDIAPYVGIGRVIVKMVNGVYKYKAEILNKVKFGEPSQDDTTKGESVEFGTSTIEGAVATRANGDWSKTETFDSKSDAIAYIEAVFAPAVPPAETYTVTFNANGGDGTLLPVEVPVGDTVTLPTTGVTKSGYTLSGWATSADATVPNVTSPYTPSADVTLYAVWVEQN